MNENTEVLFSQNNKRISEIKQVLKEVSLCLEELDYNPIRQIAGYLQSGDITYISSYKDCRSKLAKYNRSEILETILRDFL